MTASSIQSFLSRTTEAIILFSFRAAVIFEDEVSHEMPVLEELVYYVSRNLVAHLIPMTFVRGSESVQVLPSFNVVFSECRH